MISPGSGSDDENREDMSDIDGFGTYDPDDEAPEPKPVKILVDCFVELLLSRVLTFKSFCLATLYIGACGIQECSKLGMPPGKHSSHYARKCKRQLGIWGDRRYVYQ